MQVYPRLWTFPVVLGVVLFGEWMLFTPLGWNPLNLTLSLVWSLMLPIALVGMAGAIGSRFVRLRPAVRVHRPVCVILPTLARMDVVPALMRVTESVVAHMPRSFDRWRLDIVVEEGADGIPVIQERIAGWPHVRLVVVPNGYMTPNATRFKARANHYALIDRLPLDDEWAYHLDDDTAITRSTARGLVLQPQLVAKAGATPLVVAAPGSGLVSPPPHGPPQRTIWRWWLAPNQTGEQSAHLRHSGREQVDA